MSSYLVTLFDRYGDEGADEVVEADSFSVDYEGAVVFYKSEPWTWTTEDGKDVEDTHRVPILAYGHGVWISVRRAIEPTPLDHEGHATAGDVVTTTENI